MTSHTGGWACHFGSDTNRHQHQHQHQCPCGHPRGHLDVSVTRTDTNTRKGTNTMLDFDTMSQLAMPVTRTKLATQIAVGDVVFAGHWTGDDYITDPDGFVTVGTWVRVLSLPGEYRDHPWEYLVKPFRHLSDSFPYFESFFLGTVPWRPAVRMFKMPVPRCDCNTSVMCCSRNDCKLHGGTTTPFAEGLVVGCNCP